MENEYERLKKEGYSEEEIKVALKEIGKVGLSEGALGVGREDRSATVTDRNNDSMRTSSIMMGYNRQRIILPNGDYLSIDEFIEAIQKSINNDEDRRVIVCKKTGKRVDVEGLISGIVEMTSDASKVVLGGASDKIKNQETKKIFVKSRNKEKLIKKGIFMLGNGRVQLPSGEYISEQELETALSQYVFMQEPEKKVIPIVPIPSIEPEPPIMDLIPPIESESPIIDPIPPIEPEPPIMDLIPPIEPESPIIDPIPPIEPEPPIQTKSTVSSKNEPEKKKVVKKSTTRWSLWPLITATVMLGASAINVVPGKTILTPHEVQNKTLSYVAEQLVETTDMETLEEAVNRMVSELNTGSEINMPSGVDYYESSDYKYGGANDSGTFGSDIRKAGKYELEYISLVYNGKIENVEFSENVNLSEFIQKTAKEKGIDETQLEVMLHIGGPVSGWVSLNDIISKSDINTREIKTIIETGDEYTGKVNDFDGTIKIETDIGETTLRVVDESGKLLDSSSIVTGSDGEKYRLSSLKLDTEREIVYTETEQKTKVTFGIHNITQEEALLAGAVAIVGTILSKRKKESTKESTETEYEEMLEEYNNSNSKFVKVVNRIEGETPAWERIDISVKKPLDVVDSRISELYEESSGKKI